MQHEPQNEDQPSCRRYVDMWAVPGMHPTNIEFLQKLKTADTNQFTKGMNVIGTLSEQEAGGRWDKTHLLGIRSDIWKPSRKELSRSLNAVHRRRKQELRESIKTRGRLSADQQQQWQQAVQQDEIMQLQSDQLEQRRLVLKLFKTTGKRVRWCGTLEELTTAEVHNSMGSRRSLVSLVGILPGAQHVTTIQENHRTARFPSTFSFCYYHEQRMWHVLLKQRWFSFGPDYDLFIDGRWHGLMDAKLLCLGADSYVDIERHPLAGNTAFCDLLTLFTASVSYHRSIRRSIRRRIRAIQSGQADRYVIDDEELRMRHNGRAAA